MDPQQLDVRQPVRLARIDRQAVRHLVEQFTLAAQAAGERGENIHQWSLDQQDRVTEFAATLPEPDAALFWTLYAEEMDASSKAMLDKAHELNMQTAQVHMDAARSAGNFATWISIVAFFAVLIGMIKIFKG